MLVRGFEAVSLGVTGGSALTKKRRPASSTTLAIWALALCAETVAQRTSVVRRSHAAFAVRFTIVPWGKANNNLEPTTERTVFNIAPTRSGSMSLRYQGPPPSVLHGDRLAMPHLANPCLRARYCLLQDTVLALPGIITKARGGRGCLTRHFLGQLCLFRQPRPNRAGHPRNPLFVWPAPVSAYQHGL